MALRLRVRNDELDVFSLLRRQPHTHRKQLGCSKPGAQLCSQDINLRFQFNFSIRNINERVQKSAEF